jgi:hypothetical protein
MLVASLGVAGLPLLPSLHAADKRTNKTSPRRLIFMGFGYGLSNTFYDKLGKGADFLNPAMAPLKKHHGDFSYISGLSNEFSKGAHDGGSTFLTSANTRRTPGRAFHNDISCDQLAASYLCNDLRYQSLALQGVQPTGNGPLSWDKNGKDIRPITNHLAVFRMLFQAKGVTKEQQTKQIEDQRSVLDAYVGDIDALNRILPADERSKVNEYHSSIREMEKSLAREMSWVNTAKAKPPFGEPKGALPGKVGATTMMDLMVGAFQTDATRVITYAMPGEDLIKEQFPTVGGHKMSHAMGDPGSEPYKALHWRDKKLCELLAELMDRLKAKKDIDGNTLLDNTLIVMGSQLRRGHTTRNSPVFIAGGKAHGVKQGFHYAYPVQDGLLSNLWLSTLQFAGCPEESFADSTGPLSEIFPG